MTSSDSRTLAESMVRFYGLTRALAMAGQHAADCGAKGDICGKGKWTVVAARIAMIVDDEQQLERDTALAAPNPVARKTVVAP